MSRRSSVISTSLTTASTCHSSPLPIEANFDDLFGTACETPTIITEFDPSFMMDMHMKKNIVDPFAFDMLNFDMDNTKQLVQDFINLDDQMDAYDQDHFVIFSNEE
ncbi:MAG: hypothetical protein GOMPHAMPRED_002678 [Gomphillus americanus]|uniref:Uncharacterized protein n=1 Tax=Gomphillus americanus TaxID=1940652 RepID=A0A8H3IL09_9LECA|nr:MAG: hypothetical protein GOMPHAMPRED_002678 [Gomphillus americanus]